MSTRAFVQHSYTRFGVDIYLTQQVGEGRFALAQPIDDLVFSEPDPAQSFAAPTLNLREDMARALLDALSAHFGGSSDVQTLRKDYMAERARVDKLIAHLTTPGVSR